MVYKGFWGKIKKPIVGLAPMDGVTDAAMRYITKKHGNPDVVFTEFVSAEGVKAGAVRLMRDFRFSEEERPVVAQLFGKDLEAFYLSTLVVCALGFDGVDINMGCPARKVANRGEGAGLIKTPDLAIQIIKEVKRAVDDWVGGVDLERVGLDKKILEYIRHECKVCDTLQRRVPVSVKTRIGYDEPVTKEWIEALLSAEPAVISLHGRTLKQRYGGKADWGEIGKAAKLCKKTETLLLGNGDVKSAQSAKGKVQKYGVDGVLIGRAAFGNPWVFDESVKAKSKSEKLKVALEHARKFEEMFPEDRFFAMRKHLSWYIKGFDGAKGLRGKLVLCSSAREVESCLSKGSEAHV